jgi:hypothetical protein
LNRNPAVQSHFPIKVMQRLCQVYLILIFKQKTRIV